MSKKSLIVVGGNRHFDDGPLDSILYFKQKNKIDLLLITDSIHISKPCKTYKTFKDYLKKKKVKYLVVNKLKNKISIFKRYLKRYPNSILLTAFCFFKINKKILRLFKNKAFNYHLGKIPEQIGASSSFWYTMNNSKETAISFHRISNELDKGELLYEKKFKLKEEHSTLDFYKHVNKQEKKALYEFLTNILNNKKIKSIKKDDEDTIYMPKLNTHIHGFIDWSWSAEEIFRFTKVFDEPFKGASTFMGQKRVYLKNVSFYPSKIKFHPFQFGIIFNKYKKKIYIACKDGYIKASLFSNKNKINMSEIILGSRLYTKQIYLDNAKILRSVHTSSGIKLRVK